MEVGQVNAVRRRDPWVIVRRWHVPAPGEKGLSPQAKMLWHYLYCLAGGIDQPAVIHTANVGRENGLSDRAVRRLMETLKRWGLIELPDRYKGEVTVRLTDPQESLLARLMPTESSGQGELEFPDNPGSPTEVQPQGPPGVIPLPAVPALARPPDGAADVTSNPPHAKHGAYARAQIKALSISIPKKTESSSGSGASGGFDAKSAAAKVPSGLSPQQHRDWLRVQVEAAARARNESRGDDSIPTIGDGFADLAQKITRQAPEDLVARDTRARQYAAWLFARLGPIDHDYRRYVEGKCLRIAWAIVEGRQTFEKVPFEMKVQDLLGRMHKTGRQPVKFFMGAMGEEFKLAGLSWDGAGVIRRTHGNQSSNQR